MLNRWLHSSEEPRPIKAVATIRQNRGPWVNKEFSPQIDHYGPVVIILATGSEVLGFDPCRGPLVLFFRA